MTQPTDEPGPPPGRDDNAQSGFTVNPGDGDFKKAVEAADNEATVTSAGYQQVTPGESTTVAGCADPNEDLAVEPANDEAAKASATMVGLRNAEIPSKAVMTARVTRSSALVAAERAAAEERRTLRLARLAAEGRTSDTTPAHRAPPVVGTGTGVLVRTAKPESRMTAVGVAGVPSYLPAEEWGDVRPSGREGKYVQSYWPSLLPT